MSALRAARRGLLVVALALLGAGCGRDTTVAGSGSESNPPVNGLTTSPPPASSLATEPPTEPPTESAVDSSPPAESANGAEPPQQGGGGGAAAAVHLPSLPIGGQPDDPAVSPECVRVSWLGGSLPPGVSISVAAVHLNPAGVFTVSDSGCGGPLCRDPRFAFANDPQGTAFCYLPVIAKGKPDETATLSMEGAARCAARLAGKCGTFAGASQITLTVPFPPDQTPSNPTPS